MQYVPELSRAGLDVALWSYFSDRDIHLWYGRTHVGRLWALLRGLTRLPRAYRLTRQAQLVLVLRDALPFGSSIPERVLLHGRRWIWDVDDAVWRHTSATAGRLPTWLRATSAKYERLCASAQQVWAGSDLLAEWCRRHTSEVVVVPTVVDVPALPSTPPAGSVAVWIGSHSTSGFLQEILPGLRREVPELHFVIVGADATKIQADSRTAVWSWSPAAEEEALRRASVGLYPIDPAHALADGKCGLKAILYMSRGIPPVVTPTPTNAAIVRDRLEGLHASSPAQWSAAVRELLHDDALRARCSRAGHDRARARYSLEVWAPRVRALLERQLQSAG
jgi:glycosyltransferase involved in cell wall biosynthesis